MSSSRSQPRPSRPRSPGRPRRPQNLETAQTGELEVSAESVVTEISYLYFELVLKRGDRMLSVVTEFGLSPSQARALARMEPKKSFTMSQVAQAALCEPSNLTGIIDKLEARGLVKRSLEPTDRRVKLVTLTRAGAVMREQLYVRFREPAPWMLALSARDQRQLLVILRKGLALAEIKKEP